MYSTIISKGECRITRKQRTIKLFGSREIKEILFLWKSFNCGVINWFSFPVYLSAFNKHWKLWCWIMVLPGRLVGGGGSFWFNFFWLSDTGELPCCREQNFNFKEFIKSYNVDNMLRYTKCVKIPFKNIHEMGFRIKISKNQPANILCQEMLGFLATICFK